MRNMQMCLGLSSQLDVAFNHIGFSFNRHAAQSQAERCWTKIHNAALREASVLGVLDYRNSDASRDAQGRAHDRVLQYRFSIVGHSHRASIAEIAIVG